MQSYQFSTRVEDGFIRIPDEYIAKLRNNITVIIINEEYAVTDIDKLFPPCVDTIAWKFNREEANER